MRHLIVLGMRQGCLLRRYFAVLVCFFFNDTATTEIYTLSLHDALPITGGDSHYGFGTILSTSQVRNSSTYGVLKLTLNSSSYSWKFVPVAGSSFTDSGTTNCH